MADYIVYADDIYISNPNQDINGSYYCNDQGIEPDIGVNRAIFYNNEKLMKFLNIE